MRSKKIVSDESRQILSEGSGKGTRGSGYAEASGRCARLVGRLVSRQLRKG